MECEPFVRYRAQLTALACEEVARAALDSSKFWTPRLHWRSTFGRFYPGAAPYAIQVFESCDGGLQRIARVEAFDSPPADVADDESWSSDSVAGFLRVTRLGADPGLPTLASILDGDAHVTVVRYHPGRRCTVRTVRNGRAVFGKVFSDDRGRELCEDYENLWRASGSGELSFAVAHPIAWDSASRTLWQAALPGDAVRPRLGTDVGPALARRIGEALGSLAQSHVPARVIFGAGDVMERSVRHGAQLVGRVPSLADEVQHFLDHLGDSQKSRLRAARPIHGAPVAAQWLATPDRLGLVDFDKFAAGDPELDIGFVVADLDFEDLPRDAVRALAAEVIEGWEAVAGPLDRGLVEVYRAHRHLRRALRTASAIRPDADQRAVRSLRRSIELLAPALT